jgi:23S rRNA pseudouridine2605 synthase
MPWPRGGPGPLSLARALSKFGVCSRSVAEQWIGAGRVTVNGAVVLDPRRRLNPRWHTVEVDGVRVGDDTERVVVALNKPAGYITTRVDPAGRPTVYELIEDLGDWVFPVGRLDRDSTGLLLMTNDHVLGQRLTDPDEHVPKTYHARVSGTPPPEVLQVLREGVLLGDGTLTQPAGVRTLGTGRDGNAWVEVILEEGKNRQVRRMLASVGHEVLELTRVRIGTLELGDLGPGAWRRLSADEVAALQG